MDGAMRAFKSLVTWRRTIKRMQTTGSLSRLRAALLVRVRQSPFVANLAVLSGASAIGALIGLAATPLISRLYSPAEFGVFGVFTAALSIASVIGTLRYDLAIPTASNDDDAMSILVVALCAVVGTSLLCVLVVVTGALGSIMSATREHTGLLAWSLPLGMLGTGVYAALSNWMVRRRDYASLGQTKVTQAASLVGTQVVLGVAGAGAIGLIIGQIAGSSAGITRLMRRIGQQRDVVRVALQVDRIAATAQRYRRFPLLSGPAVLLDALTGALPLLVLASRFGATTAGVFTMVQRILLAPMSILTTNLGQIIFGDLSALRRENSEAMMSVFHRRLRQIALMAFVVIGSMTILVPVVLPIVLGPRWGMASTYFLILSPMLFGNFVSAPFGFVIDVLRRQDLHFLRDGSRAFVLIMLLAVAQATDANAVRTLGLISIAGCINAAVYLGISWYALHVASGQRNFHLDETRPAVTQTIADEPV